MSIEESIQQIETLIEAWQLDEADLNQTDINAMQALLKENQELKKRLEEYLIQNIDLRADIMIQKMAFPNELIKDKTFYDLYNMPTYENLLTQQKEFINYLEDKIYSIEPKGTGINYNCEYDSEEDYVMAMQEQSRLNILKEILQKYRSIIGESDV